MSTAPRPSTEPYTKRGVVIGGGLAGMLAASALRHFVDEVFVLERHCLPEGPLPRRGVPQAPHVHTMWSGGAEAVELLALGAIDRLLEHGARRLAMPSDMVALSPGGWYRRWPETHYLIACSKDLLDWVVREQVLSEDVDQQISVFEQIEVVGLRRWASEITAVRVRLADGSEVEVSADFVVDASGRSSQAPKWLAELGIAQAPAKEVDSGLVYASRLYRAPEGTERFPIFSVQADPLASPPGRSATLLPIEQGQWLVSLGGTRGGAPTSDPADFEGFARSLRHPVIADALMRAEPLSPISVTHATSNTRRYFERVRFWPDRFVVLGDAVACFNPIYGQGMSVAAHSAVALRTVLADGGVRFPGISRRAQRAISRPVDTAWKLSTSQDVLYPGATGRRTRLAERAASRYSRRLAKAATGRAHLAERLTEVITMERGAAALLAPGVVCSALRGPLLPQLAGPPLNAKEREVLEASRAGVATSSKPNGPEPGAVEDVCDP
ncbi:FAD-dependent oxidoreductase [Streptomyces xantholiticus]